MQRQRFARLSSVAAAGSLAVIVGVLPAFAGADAAAPATLEPDHPLPAGCGRTDNAGMVPSAPGVPNVNFEDAEVEPYIAVDRTNPLNVVAVYQQDRWSTGGSHGLMTNVSHDGGASFTALSVGTPGTSGSVPAFSRCTGGTSVDEDFERASDPWVTFAANGDAYQIAIAFDVSQGGFGGPNSVQVSKSPASSHGDTWQVPVRIKFDTSTTVLNDKESITADPTTSNNVYAVWDRLVSPSENAASIAAIRSKSFHGPAWFDRTTSGGTSWETARVIFDPGTRNQTIGNQIIVTPTDLLMDGFMLITNRGSAIIRGNQLQVAEIRSSDQGVTWTGPTIIDRLVDAPVTLVGADGTRQPVRTGDIEPEFAVDRTSGTLYATWQDGRFSTNGIAQVAFSESKDGGLSWSPTIRINAQTSSGKQAFTPQIAVADDGTVGVSYYQFDNDVHGITTAHVVHCHASSADCTSTANWRANGDVTIGGPFAMDTAPFAEGFFVGDYEGLTDFRTHGFMPFFVMSQSAASRGPTDPFSTTVCPTTGAC
jgi:hypothetical protein